MINLRLDENNVDELLELVNDKYPLTKELAKVFARKDAIKSLWSYNPDRNIL